MTERAATTGWIDPAAVGRCAAALLLGAALGACGGLSADGGATSDRDTIPEPSEHRLDQTLATLLEDALALPAGDRRFARYFVLTPASSDPESWDTASADNAESSAERATWRARVGASKLANSLSTEPLISVPRAIDDAELLLRIDLRDYAWDRAVNVGPTAHADGWEAIASAARLAPELEGPHADRLKAITGSSRPFLFANDFIATASEGELYYGLLGVPDRLDELRARLSGATLGEARVQRYRAGFDTSGISTEARAVERLASIADPSLGYWQVFDFDDHERAQKIFTEPLDFAPDGTEVIFDLPNGLFGYFLASHDGARVSASSVRSVVNPTVPDFVLRSAAACSNCHNTGVIAFEDTVRERTLADSSRSAASRLDEVLGVYPEQALMNQFKEETNRRFELSLQRAGQEPDQPDPVSRVHIDELYRPLRSDIAAAQLFVDPAAIPDGLLPDTLMPDPYRDAYGAALCELSRPAQNHPSGCR